MNRLTNAWRVVPLSARILAVLVYLTFAALMVLQQGTAMNFKLSIGLAAVPAAIISLLPAGWILCIGYVYGDARRRGMRYVAWTLIAIFVPSAIGIILYFVMRENMRTCGSCGATIKCRHPYCPRCGAAAGQACPNCHRQTEPAWRNCANCGAVLDAPSA